MMRLLDRGHTLSLAALDLQNGARTDNPLLARLRAFQAVPGPLQGTHWQRLRDYVLSRVPPPFWPYWVPELYPVVGEMVAADSFDLVIAETVPMGLYLHRNPWLPKVRTVISTHSCAGMARRTAMYLPERTWWTSAREHVLNRDLVRFEFMLYRAVDQVWTLSEQDRFTLQAHSHDLRVSVVPAGVDSDYFRPGTEPIDLDQERLLFTGQFQDEQNRDAFRWFVTHAWPLVQARRPRATFRVVGPGMDDSMHLLAARYPGVELVGEMRDIRPELQRARIFVSPLRIGSGLRIKILEAMAAGVPVVMTSNAAEGIPAQAGVNAMLADDPRKQAAAIDLLLSDPVYSRQIASRARVMVLERFNWDRAIDCLESAVSGGVLAG
jgi:glycosyltransferase involved in cell wall biosynthesis